MTRVVGIDGGGTRTRCLIADGDGAVLGQGQAGPANCATLPLSVVADTIFPALVQACAAAGCAPADLDALCAGLAGFYPPWHAEALTAALAERLPDSSRLTASLVPDLAIAWAGGTALAPGVVLVGGTGSVAYGRNAAGEAARAGGWGHLAGDEGSAYWIGREALRAIALALDARGEGTALVELLPGAHRTSAPTPTPYSYSYTPFPAATGVGVGVRSRSRSRPSTPAVSAEQWLRTVYREAWTPAQIGALAPVVFDAADGGDTVAHAILTRAGEQLGRLAGHVLTSLRLDGEDSPVAAVGGVLERAGPVREAAAAWLRSATRARLQPALLPPVAGAVLLALEQLEIRPGAAVIARLGAGSEQC